nr:PTS sugar transporter subunit IIC [bacterium]
MKSFFPAVWSGIKKVGLFIYRRYLLQAMGAMAQGLFASLIIGLILSQIARIPGLGFIAPFAEVLGAKSPVVGAAIGVAVAFGLKSVPLAIFAAAGAGAYGYNLGGPVGAYLAAIAAAECGRLVAGKTPVDIVLVPAVAILSGGVVGWLIGPPINAMMNGLGAVINHATVLQPIPMGIAVASIMGLALTAPISSAALAIMLGLDGLAAGAATAGCCAHMMGFAVASWRDNGIGGFLAQGLGTSMLQVENILKKPAILLPAMFAAAVMGPLATTLFGALNTPTGAGMGTSGLVGPLGMWEAMAAQAGQPAGVVILKIVLLCFVLPSILAWMCGLLLRRVGWIKPGDMALNK